MKSPDSRGGRWCTTARVASLAALTVLSPCQAFAQASAEPSGDAVAGLVASLLASALALVVAAALVGRLAPERRRHMRFSLTLFALNVLAAGAAVGLAVRGPAGWAGAVAAAATLLQHALVIDLVGVGVFFLMLPRVGVVVPDIARDLIVGLAYALASWAALRRAGVDVSSLVATSAVVTVLLGVSLQPTLASVFGGVALQIDGSIGEGDWVRLPDRLEGRVRQIRWRHTVIETRNHDTVIVPNSQLLQQSIVILGRRDGAACAHRMWVYFSVESHHSPARVVEVVLDMLRTATVEGMAVTPPPSCICLDLGHEPRGAVRYAVRYFLEDLARDDPVNSEVMLRVHAALQRSGIELAGATQTLSLQAAGPAARAEAERREVARRVALLEGIELFASMTDDERAYVAARLRPAPFVRGETITRQGAEAHWLYIIASGAAEISVRRADGVERSVARVDAPGVVGEMGLLTGAPRMATVRAAAPVECLRLDKEDFREVLTRRPEVASQLSAVLAQRQLATQKALASDDERHADADEAQTNILASVRRFFGLEDD